MPNVTLESVFTDIAGAIRSKTGDAGLLVPTEMATAIEEIPTGGDYDSGVWEIWDGTGTKLAAEPLDKSFYELQISSLVPAGSHTLIWIDDTDGEPASTLYNILDSNAYLVYNGALTYMDEGAYAIGASGYINSFEENAGIYYFSDALLSEKDVSDGFAYVFENESDFIPMASGIYLIENGHIRESDTFGNLPLKAVWYYDESWGYFFNAGLPNANFYCDAASGWQLANYDSYFYGGQCLTEFHVGADHIAQNGYGSLSEIQSHTLIWIDSITGSATHLSQSDGIFQVENGVFKRIS